MKRLSTVLAILAIFSFVSCTSAAEAPKMDKPAEVRTDQKAENKVLPKEQQKAPTLQELQAQRTMTMLRIEGAEASKQAVERLILDARVSLKQLEAEIAKLEPKQTQEQKPTK